MRRRAFIGSALGGLAAGLLPAADAPAGGDTLAAAFRSLGFDPAAPGCTFFVVTSDIHAERHHARLAEHVAAWNALSPKPAFVAALGDFGYVSGCFGDRPTPARAAQNAAAQFGAVRRILSEGLRPDVARVYVVGNHDTYLGEEDRALWRAYFPDQPPYCAFDACGIRFVKWDGGVDGIFDARQESWIRATVASVPAAQPLAILVHQPSVGQRGMERDVGRVAKEVLAGRPGVTWLLGGHGHANGQALWDLPGGGRLAVAMHTMDAKGWWAYGVRDGRIVARVFKGTDAAFAPGADVAAWRRRGEIPTAFAGRADVAWRAFVGSPDERACRVRLEKTADNGGWLFYVGTVRHRFPKARLAPRATRFAMLGSLCGKRGTREPARCFLSADGETWTEVARRAVREEVNEFPIPSALVGAETLHVRYEAFGFGCDECVAGYAFLD